MKSTTLILIFDIGKTNKKWFLLNQDYRVVEQNSVCLPETKDEDGFPAEDVVALKTWIKESLLFLISRPDWQISAINFSAYGASLVHVNAQGQALSPLYSYLKPYPQELLKQFYSKQGGELAFSLCTASPVLGSLNSGLQVYRIKQQNPDLFKNIFKSLHLPQYLSGLISNKYYSDLTSIGCHTALWNFSGKQYHDWVFTEHIFDKLAPIASSTHTDDCSLIANKRALCGVGLHDSSAALIPYLNQIKEPFILISTGTWCISLNPFNREPLTQKQLASDCLFYLNHLGNPVKAARYFGGQEHQEQTARIAQHFDVNSSFHKNIRFERSVVKELVQMSREEVFTDGPGQRSPPVSRSLRNFTDHIHAYHQLMLDIVRRQAQSTRLVMGEEFIADIFVDGGFCANSFYMNLLASAFPKQKVYSATLAQASAVGAAMAIHSSWNSAQLPESAIEIKHYLPDTFNE